MRQSTHYLFVLTTSLLLAIAFTSTVRAQGYCETCARGARGPYIDSYGPRYGRTPSGPRGDCFDPPFFEREPGWNLYWHDPCNCWADPCRNWNCQLANQPLVYGETSVAFFFRDEEGSFTAGTNAVGNTLLSSNDFKPEHEIGGKFLVGVALDDWTRVEGLYFGQFDWSDDQAVRSAAADIVSPFPVADSDFAGIGMSSRMHNTELNLRRRVCLPPFRWRRAECNVLVGIRYMEINEAFTYTNLNVGATSVASNSMVGVQIGTQSQFFVLDRGWIDFEIKGAIFANDAEMTSTYVDGGTP
ncbi:MAG: hypothetical protein AAF497_23075, partial [Planctomycetota bacterium]